MTRRPVLMGVFAHPDDESFGPGGTFARYAAEGVDVHIVIATDGIAGSVEDEAHVKDHDSLAQVRSAELARAAVALGVKTIWSLPYRDSGMRGSPDNEHPDALIRQPLEHTIAEVLEYVRRLQPDVIVTHDPYGGYGHPDHIRVCEATTAAFHIARGDPGSRNGHPDAWRGPQKLYYPAFDKRVLKATVRIMPLLGQDPTAIGRNRDIDLVEISRWPSPVHAQVDVASFVERKLAASRAHASQFSGGPAFARVLPRFLRRRFLARETFTRAFPGPTARRESDLFAGVG